MTSPRITFTVGLVALVAPLVLLALGASFRPAGLVPWREPALVASSWIYMASPSLLVMFFALVVRPARHTFLPAALVTSTALLIAFQLWVWFAVPVRDSALSWVIYHPLCALALLAVGLIAAARKSATAARD